MLVLNRKQSESIVIGKNLVRIYVVSIIGDAVKIGIEAPDSLSVHRHEIYAKIVEGGDLASLRGKEPQPGNVAIRRKIEKTRSIYGTLPIPEEKSK